MPIFSLLAIGSITMVFLEKKYRRNKRYQQKIQASKQAIIPFANKEKPTKTDVLADMGEVNHFQKTALLSFGLTGLGKFVYPPLTFVAIPLLIYNYAHYLKKSHHIIFKQKKWALGITELTSVTFALVTASYFTMAFLFSMYFTTRKLIMKTERDTQLNFSQVFGELPKTVWLWFDGIEREIMLDNVQINDILVVHAGEMIAVDGIIVSGHGVVDQRMLTGEAQPLEKIEADPVFTSTVLISGYLRIQVEKKGEETITGQVAKVLQSSANFKNKMQSRGELIVEKGAQKMNLTTVAALPFIGLNHALALGYAGFGYQMRLSAPLMVFNYLKHAAKNGILIKDGRALENISDIDIVVFDKTGTLTQEVPQIENMISCRGFSKTQLLQYAATAEQHQKHPIALAICAQAQQQGLEFLALEHADYRIGHGICVSLRDENNQIITVLLGSARFMQQSDISISHEIQTLEQQCAENGHSLVYIAQKDQGLMGVIELSPTLRTNAQLAIKTLQEQGKTIYIISGDQKAATAHLADSLGIEDYFAETLPEDKANIIADLQSKGHKVCFVGDGINDSIALQKADVSISLKGASSIAMDTAEIVLLQPNLLLLSEILTMSHQLDRRMSNSMVINTGSGILCISSVLFLGLGFSGAMVLYYSSLSANIVNAMLPMAQNKIAR